MFNYVYGILHSPTYRKRFAADCTCRWVGGVVDERMNER
ncbi:MAG: hypothetical protein M1483_05550 [Actinobacteria bacterium]|nr:hypothetical protein [Actinomycetota bacterium]MCL6105076.1 hypothetical protein [Actinomycetota bacterium]